MKVTGRLKNISSLLLINTAATKLGESEGNMGLQSSSDIIKK